MVAGSGFSDVERRLHVGLARAAHRADRTLDRLWVGPDVAPAGWSDDTGRALDLSHCWDCQPLRTARVLRSTPLGSRVKDAWLSVWLRLATRGPILVLASGLSLLPWLDHLGPLVLLLPGDRALARPTSPLSAACRLLLTTPAAQRRPTAGRSLRNERSLQGAGGRSRFPRQTDLSWSSVDPIGTTARTWRPGPSPPRRRV